MANNTGMEQLIPLVNKLQDIYVSLGLPLDIDLPQIAVVGSQSAGKSSVLENFVGKDFLPRGSGIVTRRPLVLQLIHHAGGEYAQFLHIQDRKFMDMGEVRGEIEADTERVAGADKGVSHQPINLRIYSPHVLNLTLIDLPGMTRLALPGQPANIADQIRAMILEFVSQKNTLILAVSPANSDLANSDALKLAKEVDPQGMRTIGVVTKLDLMDEGTDAQDILENKHFPLRRGYVGIVNRSQKDIDGKKDITAAMAAEKTFFNSHPSYSHMAGRMGSTFLQRTLNEQLTNHIRDSLPPLRAKLQKQLVDMEKDVEMYKNFAIDDPSRQTRAMMGLINQFSSDFHQNIHNGDDTDILTTELSGGAKMNCIFHEKFPYDLVKIRSDEEQMRQQIHFAIKNIHGIKTGLFTPDMAFEVIVRDQVERIRLPSLCCVDQVLEELRGLVRRCAGRMGSYPQLREEVERSVLEHMASCEAAVKQHIQMMIDCHAAYINTNHEDFISWSSAKKRAEPAQASAPAPKSSNQVIRKGWLTIAASSLLKTSKEFWFTLTSESLQWYKDSEETDKKNEIPLDSVSFRNLDIWSLNKKPGFCLVDHAGQKLLEVYTETNDEAEAWKASFIRVGVYPAAEPDASSTTNVKVPIDDELEKQVEMIRVLVNSYLKIVHKTQKDMVPKYIMTLLINQMKTYTRNELLAYIYAQDTKELMAESDEEKKRREDMLRLYHAITEAIKVIGEVIQSTKSTPLPPPVEIVEPPADWAVTPSMKVAPRAASASPNAPRRHARPAPAGPPPTKPAPPAPTRTAAQSKFYQ